MIIPSSSCLTTCCSSSGISDTALSENPAAQYKLAHTFEFGQTNKQDFPKAVELYERSANSGYWLAKERLRQAYNSGELGLQVDHIQAARYEDQLRSVNANALEYPRYEKTKNCTDDKQ